MATFGVYDIKKNLSAHLKTVEAGECVGISRNGRLIAFLVPRDSLVDLKPFKEAVKRNAEATEQLSSPQPGAPLSAPHPGPNKRLQPQARGISMADFLKASR